MKNAMATKISVGNSNTIPFMKTHRSGADITRVYSVANANAPPQGTDGECQGLIKCVKVTGRSTAALRKADVS
jgi:hypothetical protein